MAERTKEIQIISYNPAWKKEFQKISVMIRRLIGDLIIKIEHVGSTSVKGLAAKPVIDIDVVIEDYRTFPEVTDRLEKAGYIYQGNLGIEGREAFQRRFNDGFMKYHLYVCPSDGKGYLEHMALRDYLREHEDERKKYQLLKIELAKKHRFDIDSYCDGKTNFIKQILQKTIYKNSHGTGY